jgi:hypothetical protein
VSGRIEVGEVFGEVFARYRAYAGVLLPIAFWLFLVVAIVDGLTPEDLMLSGAASFVSLPIGMLYQGVVVTLVRDVPDGGSVPSMAQVLRGVLSVLGPLVIAAILYAIGTTIGFLLLLVPGLFLVTIWAVIAPVIVIEKAGALAAFSRSRELVKGSGWPVLGVVVLAVLISTIGWLLFAGIAEGLSDGPLVRIVFVAIASTITAPVAGLATAVLYYRLLAIERGGAPPESVEPA